MLTYFLLFAAFLFLTWIPHFRLHYRVWRNHGKKMPPFASWTLPYFGHSLDLFIRKEEKFVLENHQKHGPVFGFYMQNLPFFCLDITNYGTEVNTSPKVDRASLPPLLSPIHGPTLDVRTVLRGIYARNLRTRLPWIQKQVEGFLRSEFSDPSQSYTRNLSSICQRACACFTLAAWFDIEYSQMAKEQTIEKLCAFHSAESGMRDITLVMPRLAPLARLRLKPYRKVIESFLGPLLKEQRQPEEGKSGNPNMLHLMQKEEHSSPSILLDTFITVLSGAMSISPSVDHLFRCFFENLEVLNEAAEEQLSVTDEISYRVLSEMKFLDVSLKETLRLEFTLASYRYVTEDLTLHDGYVLPAGSHFILTGAGVNYDENIFFNSHKWNPKRWIELDEKDKTLNEEDTRRKDAFIWGSGKVFCPGREHALMGMKLVSALILRNLSVSDLGEGNVSLKLLPNNRLFPKS